VAEVVDCLFEAIALEAKNQGYVSGEALRESGD